MITKSDLKIYQRYNGDIDMWQRAGNKKKEMVDDWPLIDTLIQDLILIQKGNASSEYIDRVNNLLHQSCEDEETIEELRRIVRHLIALK